MPAEMTTCRFFFSKTPGIYYVLHIMHPVYFSKETFSAGFPNKFLLRVKKARLILSTTAGIF